MVCEKCGKPTQGNARICSSCRKSEQNETETKRLRTDVSSVFSNLGNNKSGPSITFAVNRRSAGTLITKIIGIISCVIGAPFAYAFFIAMSDTWSSHTAAIILLIIAAAFIGFGVFFIIRSHKLQNGSLTINDEKVTYLGRGGKIDIGIGRITSVHQNGQRVSIVYNGGHLSFASNRAYNIVDELNKRVTIVSPSPQPTYSARQQVKSEPVIGKADEIKKYKELLDSGAITQEQYDSIIKKMIS